MVMKKTGYASLILASFLLMNAGYMYADEFHFNSLLVGDRAAALGGAYTAISNDTSGLYYNPAGIAYAETGVSASINAYGSSETRYKNVIGNLEWKKSSGEIIPGMLGGVYKLPEGKGTLGCSIVTTNSELVSQDQKFSNITLEGQPWWDKGILHYGNNYRVYNVGFSYGYPISDTFSIGTTLYGHWKKKEEILNQKYSYDYPDGAHELYLNDINIDETEWGILPMLGLMWKPNEKYSLGLSVSRTFVISEDYEYDYTLSYTFDLGDSIFFDSKDHQSDSDDKREYPWVIKLGAAYAFSPALLVSWDLTYYTATDRQDNDDMIPSTFDTKSFFNTALGTEYHISDNWILHTGFFTNLANTDMDAILPDERRESIDMYGGTLGMTYKTGEYLINIGAAYSAGTGKATVGEIGGGRANVYPNEPVDAQRYLWNVFLSLSK